MTTTTKIGIGIAALLAYSLFRKGAAAGTLHFYERESQTKITLDGITPVITLAVMAQNTSNQSFTIYSMAGDLYANNYLVGNVSNFLPVTLAPNSETIIYIKVRMKFIGLVNEIMRAFTTKSFKAVVELNAQANIDRVQANINLSFSIGRQ